MRVRICVDASGASRIKAEPLEPLPALRIGLARQPIDAHDRFLYHKTTHRAVYEAVRNATPEYDDVLMWNEDGELTESTFANLIACIEGRWYTPPVSSGLLPGIMRQVMLDRGELVERVIRIEDLEVIEDLRLINSVRGQIGVCLENRPLSAVVRA
jgi:para-aminobenzoate synthetase/4-amino-4-deoxychorismate lyase